MRKRMLRLALGVAYMALLTLFFLSQMQAFVHETGRWRAAIAALAIGVPWAIVLRLYLRVAESSGSAPARADRQESREKEALAGAGEQGERTTAGNGDAQKREKVMEDEGAQEKKRARRSGEAQPYAADLAAVREWFDGAVQGYCLTEREREVAWLLYRGYTNRRIGEELFIAETTVKKHVSHIYEKMCVAGRKEFRGKL